MSLSPTSPALVLLIERHPLMREALLATLASEPGLRVVAQLADGDIAVPTAVAAHPDVIVLSLSDSGADEVQTLGALRRALPAVPIVALTAHDGLNQAQAALAAGASGVVTKTTARDELVRVVCALLNASGKFVSSSIHL